MSWYESRLYRGSPRSIRSLIASGRSLARRSVYAWGGMAQILADMEVMDGWTRRHMEEYQGERLRDLVLWAAQKAPYYRETFRRVGIRPDDIRGIQDLPRLPTLDKNVVRGDPRRFLAERRWPALLIRGHTSGSTGVPLVVYGDITSACWEEALLTRWRRRAGVQPRHRRVWVRGDQIVPPGQTARKPWLRDRAGRLLMVSSYHLDQEHLPGIVEEMRRFAPVAVEGYPGSLMILASYLKQHGVGLGVRAVLTSSEQVLSHQRLTLQEGFGAEVFDQYGMTERVASASECPRHRLHVDTECTIVEILRPDGSVCMPGEIGEVTGTNLTNFSMPLLRYRTGDMAACSAEPCSCGIKSPVVERLHGREEDFVVSASGKRFSPTILTFPFDTASGLGIEESQVVQTAPGHLTVRLVAIAGYPDHSLALAKRHIADGLSQRLGGTFTIDFEIISHIERQAHGKFRWIISGVSGGTPSR